MIEREQSARGEQGVEEAEKRIGGCGSAEPLAVDELGIYRARRQQQFPRGTSVPTSSSLCILFPCRQAAAVSESGRSRRASSCDTWESASLKSRSGSSR
jgi:hypothetical protein